VDFGLYTSTQYRLYANYSYLVCHIVVRYRSCVVLHWGFLWNPLETQTDMSKKDFADREECSMDDQGFAPGGATEAVEVELTTAAATLKGLNEHSRLEDTTVRLLWSRLHELETLKSRVEEMSALLLRVESIRTEIVLSLNQDLHTTLCLARTCLAGRAEVRSNASFSDMFASLIAHLYSKYRATGGAD
jgi:hypothetical protein